MSPFGIQVREAEPIEKALRRLKKKLQKEGLMKEVRKNRFFIKPSKARRIKHSAAIRRARKRSRLQGI